MKCRAIFFLIFLIFLIALIIARDFTLPPKTQITTRMAVVLIEGYQSHISPFLRGIISCKHTPTCSSFAILELDRNGVAGWGKIVTRILSCK